MKKLRKYFESPKDRKQRKNKEFALAVWRTIGTWLGVAAALTSVVINALVFYKVYHH